MSDRHRLASAVSALALGVACPAMADSITDSAPNVTSVAPEGQIVTNPSLGGTSRLPLQQNGGVWPSGHVQGVAVDVQGGYIYYSFTNLLAKYDFSGKLVGTLVGWTGHL